MSISSTLRIATSGVKANAQAVAVAADNIANVSTAGYEPADIGFVSVGVGSEGAGVRASIRPAVVLSAPQLEATNGVDLATEFVRLITAESAYRASASLIRAGEDMHRRAIDTTA